MNHKPLEPPQSIIKFANIIFFLGILFCLLITAYATYRIFNPIYVPNLGDGGIKTFYIFSMISGCVFASLFGLGLKKLSNNLKVNLSILIFTIGVSIYGFETYLELSHKDTKTRMDALEDLKVSGVEGFPNVFPYNLIESNGLVSDKGRIYPLGTISNSKTILSNEAGFYPIIETDEHGFNNPKGLYVKNKVDILLTGDSYTEGFSVHSNAIRVLVFTIRNDAWLIQWKWICPFKSAMADVSEQGVCIALVWFLPNRVNSRPTGRENTFIQFVLLKFERFGLLGSGQPHCL